MRQATASTFLTRHSAPANIRDWKGGDIVAFQEDLFANVNTSVSEKWFYTYMKNDAHKLPRIDMLNLLSTYAGYQNWNDFKARHSDVWEKSEREGGAKKYVSLLVVALVVVGIYYLMVHRENDFEFCFVDETKNEAVHSYLNIKILKEDETPLYFKTDSVGCFRYKTRDDLIRFVVQSPYYKTDTIIRSVESSNGSIIKLITDDYALMLHYYSNGNVQDWKERKRQLQTLLADDAQIYQVYPGGIGIELYTKKEFIHKLTTPTNSLKNIQIIDRAYSEGKVIRLKFIVK
ncbi:MAG: hypothetical protein AB3N16_12920 [Flavobacteriaceae bacterium]